MYRVSGRCVKDLNVSSDQDLLDYCITRPQVLFIHIQTSSHFFYWNRHQFERPESYWPEEIEAAEWMNMLLQERKEQCSQ